MQKQDFMRKLRGELLWHLSSSELKEITQEYEGYFATAKAGSTDEAIVAELGDPALVAAEILSERYGKVASNKMPLGLAFAFVAFAVTFLTYVIKPYLGNARFYWESADKWYLNGVQLLVLTPTVLAFLVYPRIKALRPVPVIRLAIANIIVLAVGALGLLYASHALTMLVTNSTSYSSLAFWSIIPMDRAGPFVLNSLLVFSIALAAFTIASLLRIFRGGQMAIPLLYLNCIGFFTIYHYFMLLRTMDSPDGFSPALEYIAMSVMVGLVITGIVCVSLFIHLRKRTSK